MNSSRRPDFFLPGSWCNRDDARMKTRRAVTSTGTVMRTAHYSTFKNASMAEQIPAIITGM